MKENFKKIKAKINQTDKIELTKRKNKNNKVCINKHDDYIYVKNAPRKMCTNCVSTSHLTQMCKNPNILVMSLLMYMSYLSDTRYIFSVMNLTTCHVKLISSQIISI